MTITENGTERQVTADKAFLLLLARRGVGGDGPAARFAMAALEEARACLAPISMPRGFDIVFERTGSVNLLVRGLRMVTKIDRFQPTAKIMIEPWVVQAALSRLGDRRFSLEEQSKIFQATRTAGKVRWPDWWEVFE